ncbi:hypothetical protein LXJ15735_03760 [Lacrimispora xylanolytica]
MFNVNIEQYGEYIAFSSPHGSFDEFEFPKFLQKTEESRADIAFCGTIRVLPDGSLNRAYFTDENLFLSGEEAYQLIQIERWIPPRLFGLIIRLSYFNQINIIDGSEQEKVQQLVRIAKKVFIYGNYAAYLDCRYDITSIHCTKQSWLYENLTKSIFHKPFEQLPSSANQPRVWIMGTPEHGNLGDQAIVYAMRKFVERSLQDIDIVEISERQLTEQIDKLRLVVLPRDIILLVGGGNLGDLYVGPERARRTIIENFPYNQMILFPQSVYYSNKSSIKNDKSLFASNTNLVLCAREKGSFEQMKYYFPNNRTLLMPDIVLSINIEYSKSKREGTLLLIRLDKESIINKEDLCKLRLILAEYFDKITLGDTIIRHFCNDREKELNIKLKQVGEAALVVTDRLHGAIFAAITNTPCIILPNHYHKVEGTYEWLKRLPYMRFCKNLEHFNTMVKELLTQSYSEVDRNLYTYEFSELYNLLKGVY